MKNDITVSNSENQPSLNNEVNIDLLRKMYARKLTDLEFKAFLLIAHQLNLNPFIKEIWPIKYDPNEPIKILISRDGYRTVIGRNPNYNGHTVDAIYSNDEFYYDTMKGEVNHKYNIKDRGSLLGAYCLVFMKDMSRPYYVFSEFSEYYSPGKGKTLWVTKPATMIKKVAEAQCIRMAIPANLNGTYIPEEFSISEIPSVKLQLSDTKKQELTDLIELTGYNIDNYLKNNGLTSISEIEETVGDQFINFLKEKLSKQESDKT